MIHRNLPLIGEKTKGGGYRACSKQFFFVKADGQKPNLVFQSIDIMIILKKTFYQLFS